MKVNFEHYDEFGGNMKELDKKLLELLKGNARLSVSELARSLGVSRTTVQDHMGRMEDRGIIAGYTVRLGTQSQERHVQAVVMLNISAKAQDEVVSACKKLKNVSALHTVAGVFDLAATVSAETTESLDQTIDALGRMKGVERTQTSVLLSTKFDR